MVKCFADSKEKVQTIMDSNGGVAILECYSKSCEDCSKLDNYLDQMSNEKNIPVILIDCEKNKDLCNCYNFKGMPSFAVAKERSDNIMECRECHDTKEVLDIFNTAVECRKNLGKWK